MIDKHSNAARLLSRTQREAFRKICAYGVDDGINVRNNCLGAVCSSWVPTTEGDDPDSGRGYCSRYAADLATAGVLDTSQRADISGSEATVKLSEIRLPIKKDHDPDRYE